MKYYVVDVFTDELFSGNPAGVCLLESFPDDSVMQKIAFENNLAETAFLVNREGYYDLRWFTPKVEMDLCGHATLGSAYVLMNYVDQQMSRVDFHTRSGILTVSGIAIFLLWTSRAEDPCHAQCRTFWKKRWGFACSKPICRGIYLPWLKTKRTWQISARTFPCSKK